MNEKLVNRRKNFVLLLVVLAVAFFAFGAVSADAASLTASAKVNSSSGAILRKSASTSSAKITTLNDNAKITLNKVVFKSKTSTKKTKRWFYVTTASGKKGYIRCDLVDTIKYSPVQGKTTAALNYRAGAGTEMKKKGTFSKGATISLVLKATPSGSSTIWYKVKKGSNYYYVSSKYVKEVVAATSSSAPTFTLSGITKPATLGAGTPFSLKGTITCNKTIQKVKIGFKDASGNWKTSVTEVVNSTKFDISTVDASLKFGALPVGNYKYCCDVYVGGKAYSKINSAFTIAKLKGPALLAKTAIDLCWPVGTSSSKYAYKGGDSVAAYKTALDSAFGSRSSWGKYTKVGASCDIFISTVCRYSGYDTKMEQSLNNQWTSFQDTSKWTEVPYTRQESELQSGDILIYKKTNGQHVTMYVKINGKGYLAEAAYYPDNPTGSKYPFINSSISKIFKSYPKMKVYRAAK